MERKLIVFSIALVIALSLFSYRRFIDISQTGFNWFNVPQPDELYLLEYEKEGSEKLGFTLYSSRDALCTIGYCASHEEKNIKSGVAELGLNAADCQKENNLANITCGTLSTRFYFNKTSSSLQDKIEFSGLDLQRKGGYLALNYSGKISLKNSGVKKFQISVNQKPILSPAYYFPSGETDFSFSEKIKSRGGRIEISGMGSKIIKDAESVWHPDFFGYIVLLFSAGISILFCRKLRLPILISVLMIFLVISSFLILQFRLSKSFGLFEWFVPLFSAVILVLLYKNIVKLKHGKTGFPKEVVKEAAVFVILYFLFIFTLKTFIGPYDIWWPYYARHAETTYQLQTGMYEDELSYLGRGGTYPQAFFEFSAQVSNILGVNSFYDIQPHLHYLLIIVYGISSYMLFINFGSRRQRIIAALLYSTMSFTLITTVIGTLHVFSFILLNISVVSYTIKGLRAFSPLPLALAFATHPITLFLFPAYVYSASQFSLKLRDLKPLFITGAIAIIVSLAFYIPIFLEYGLPYSIESQRWGFGLTYGIPGMMSDFQYALPLSFLAIGLCFIYKKLRLPSVFLVLVLIFYTIVAYRVNMIASIMMAGIVAIAMKEFLENKLVFISIVSALAVHFLVISVIYSGTASWCAWGSVKPQCTLPMDYLRAYTSTQDSVAINPEFGHLETFLGERKVLADLYVEYADQKKFSAADNFYQQSNSSYLNGFGVDWMVLDDIGKKRDLLDKDRVYDNGFFHIFRVY